MRRVKLMIGALAISLCLCACGGAEGTNGSGAGNTSAVENNEKKDSETTANVDKEVKENKESKNEEVTMDALLNHPVTPTEQFEFRPYGDGVEVANYLGDDKIVVLPDEVDGKKIVRIGSGAFDKESIVEAIKISDSVEAITDSFDENKNLKYVVCGNGLKKIGDNAFFSCSSIEVLELNEGLETVGGNAFAGLTNLKYLYIPDTVKEIHSIAIPYIYVSKEFVLGGKAGSAAEEYAAEYKLTFEAVE